ncbi:hypothetical protein BKA63DRAFT_568670 [Paraphoma chrysanthemicola]|nr:hypothetical protein BKA63DRAFT_568670 [Paraphoma chrysanthemicola]
MSPVDQMQSCFFDLLPGEIRVNVNEKVLAVFKGDDTVTKNALLSCKRLEKELEVELAYIFQQNLAATISDVQRPWARTFSKPDPLSIKVSGDSFQLHTIEVSVVVFKSVLASPEVPENISAKMWCLHWHTVVSDMSGASNLMTNFCTSFGNLLDYRQFDNGNNIKPEQLVFRRDAEIIGDYPQATTLLLWSVCHKSRAFDAQVHNAEGPVGLDQFRVNSPSDAVSYPPFSATLTRKST